MTPTPRITPYELVLEPLEHDAFPEIRAEAEQRGRDALRHDDFLLLGTVGATLSSMIQGIQITTSATAAGAFAAVGRPTISWGANLSQI